MANTQINITANGTKTLATVGKYCDRNIDVNVNVPVPSGYIKPSGSKSITTNGTHDVTQYASAVVNVETAKPTQFTNLYDPANVTIDYRVNASSSSGITYTADTETNYIKVPYTHKAGETVEIRLRGISTVRSRLDFVILAQDGTTRVNHAQWSSYISSVSYDEYGDAVISFKSGFVVTNTWYYIMFNFQYPYVSSASTALTGPIITINEPIGNGGHV